MTDDPEMRTVTIDVEADLADSLEAVYDDILDGEASRLNDRGWEGGEHKRAQKREQLGAKIVDLAIRSHRKKVSKRYRRRSD